MSVPNFVGLFDFDEDILADCVDLEVESGVLGPGRWEELVDVFEGLIERYYLHQQFYLLLQLLLPRAQLVHVGSLVVVLDPELLPIGCLLHHSQILTHLAHHRLHNLTHKITIQGCTQISPLLHNNLHNVLVGGPVHFHNLQQSGHIQYILSHNLRLEMIQIGQLCIFLLKMHDSVINQQCYPGQVLDVLECWGILND